MAGDFHVFFDTKLDSQSGNPTLKKSLAKRIELKESYDLCDMWRVRNTKSKWFPFTLKHSSGFIQRGLDYMFISNTLQEFLTMAEILTPISKIILLYTSLFQKKKAVSQLRDSGNLIAP